MVSYCKYFTAAAYPSQTNRIADNPSNWQLDNHTNRHFLFLFLTCDGLLQRVFHCCRLSVTDKQKKQNSKKTVKLATRQTYKQTFSVSISNLWWSFTAGSSLLYAGIFVLNKKICNLHLYCGDNKGKQICRKIRCTYNFFLYNRFPKKCLGYYHFYSSFLIMDTIYHWFNQLTLYRKCFVTCTI